MDAVPSPDSIYIYIEKERERLHDELLLCYALGVYYSKHFAKNLYTIATHHVIYVYLMTNDWIYIKEVCIYSCYIYRYP